MPPKVIAELTQMRIRIDSIMKAVAEKEGTNATWSFLFDAKDSLGHAILQHDIDAYERTL